MSTDEHAYDGAVDVAARHARAWLDSLADRPILPRTGADELAVTLGPLPDWPDDPAAVVDLLARSVEPGLMGMPSGASTAG